MLKVINEKVCSLESAHLLNLLIYCSMISYLLDVSCAIMVEFSFSCHYTAQILFLQALFRNTEFKIWVTYFLYFNSRQNCQSLFFQCIKECINPRFLGLLNSLLFTLPKECIIFRSSTFIFSFVRIPRILHVNSPTLFLTHHLHLVFLLEKCRKIQPHILK